MIFQVYASCFFFPNLSHFHPKKNIKFNKQDAKILYIQLTCSSVYRRQ